MIIMKIWRGAIANLNFAEQMYGWDEVELGGKRSVQKYSSIAEKRTSSRRHLNAKLLNITF